MYFSKTKKALTAKQGFEQIKIEGWGKDSLRIRATQFSKFTDMDWALTEKVGENTNRLTIEENDDGSAVVTNGRISVRINAGGVMTFYSDKNVILREYYRNYFGTESKESCCLKVVSREYKPIIAGDYKINVRFESNDSEKIYGMGQYQQPWLNLKGCVLELAQRNSQVSVPFLVSNLGYGLLWNNPGIGKAAFGKNYTEWSMEASKEIDYWITVGDTPKEILRKYTDVSGRAPEFSSDLLGLWQCKLRYRTQDEVLEVARKYKKLGIPLDVIVIDFFHWTRQGDWKFDPVYWPDPKGMCDELHSMGTKVAVSIWPTVDKKSENYQEMSDRGLLIRTEHGSRQTFDFQGDCVEIDITNPEARKYIWEKCRKNYVGYGIDMFWLDETEPEYAVYDFDNFRYYLGCALEVSNYYPQMMAMAFYDGMKKCKIGKGIPSLVRSAWAGSQKYSSLVWSGDVQSTFETLRDQLSAGLNMGLAGIPWWTTDIGGFMTNNVEDPKFVELLLRWYEFAVFTPVLRMHGDRGPHDIPALSDQDWGGGYLVTGRSNELWSYGDEAFKVMKKNLDLRISLKKYVEDLMKEASKNGSPLMRTMFYEFPEDQTCWDVSDQYMFGSKYLVAPVLEAGMTERKVYLPEGNWEDIRDGKICSGKQTITAKAPLDSIPVFIRRF
jgi:alpha-D-xyloside xylohydrolase